MYNVTASEDASAISHTIWIFRCNDIAFFIYFQVITFADKTCIWFVTSSDNDFIYRHNLEFTSTVDTSTIFVKSHHFVFEAFYLVFTFYTYWRRYATVTASQPKRTHVRAASIATLPPPMMITRSPFLTGI